MYSFIHTFKYLMSICWLNKRPEARLRIKKPRHKPPIQGDPAMVLLKNNQNSEKKRKGVCPGAR